MIQLCYETKEREVDCSQLVELLKFPIPKFSEDRFQEVPLHLSQCDHDGFLEHHDPPCGVCHQTVSPDPRYRRRARGPSVEVEIGPNVQCRVRIIDHWIQEPLRLGWGVPRYSHSTAQIRIRVPGVCAPRDSHWSLHPIQYETCQPGQHLSLATAVDRSHEAWDGRVVCTRNVAKPCRYLRRYLGYVGWIPGEQITRSGVTLDNLLHCAICDQKRLWCLRPNHCKEIVKKRC
jgi:hypothetical protein